LLVWGNWRDERRRRPTRPTRIWSKRSATGCPGTNAWDLLKNRYVFLPSEEERSQQDKEVENQQPDWDAI